MDLQVLLVWGIEEQHVSELLSRVALILGDSKEKIQSHYGALVIFQSLGKAAIGWLYPLLKSFLPLLEKRYPVFSGTSNIQVEEIRGTLLVSKKSKQTSLILKTEKITMANC